ncbi:MAG: amidase [Acidimicrobiales bacterium]|jgi:amidase
MDEQLAWMDATAQAELVSSGKASPAELVDAAIERIERLNPELNAVIHERFDAARSEAAAGGLAGPFAGVPILLKDLNAAMAGEPHYAGLRAAKEAGYLAPVDSFIVERLRAAGCIILGRTNCPEFGTTITTEPLAYGPTRNPWNTDHTTGGSSGGSAAAVASGMVPVAHANDGGGSIRIPASNCGLFGLKPSRGRVSPGPDPHESSWAGSTIDHVLTRTVRDSAAMLDVLAGEMPGDLFVAPPPARPFSRELPADLGQLKIGWLDHPAQDGITANAECATAVHEARDLLESLGHELHEAHPDALGDPEFTRHFLTLITTAVAADVENWSEAIGRTIAPSELEPDNQTFQMLGAMVPATAYLRSELWFEAWRRRLADFWSVDGYDLLLTPVLNMPPARLGELSEPILGQQRVIEALQYTAQFNVSGQPAMSLPLHRTADGLPVGVQLVAAYGREDVLLRLACQVEQAEPWADLRPPVQA